MAEREKQDVKLFQEVLEVAREHLQVWDKYGLKCAVHEQTGLIKVTLLDKETGETVREVPHQQVLDLIGKIDEVMSILSTR